MKRIIAIFITLILLYTAVYAVAEKGVIDFSEYTDDELIELQKEIQYELDKRRADLRVLQSNTFVANKNIQAGTYILTCVNQYGECNSCGVNCYYTEEGFVKRSTGVFFDLKQNDSFFLNLREGVAFDFEYGDLSIEPVEPNFVSDTYMIQGDYFIGIDLFPGEYYFTLDDITGNYFGVEVFTKEEDFQIGLYDHVSCYYPKEGEKFMLRLRKGDVLKIRGCKLHLNRAIKL